MITTENNLIGEYLDNYLPKQLATVLFATIAKRFGITTKFSARLE